MIYIKQKLTFLFALTISSAAFSSTTKTIATDAETEKVCHTAAKHLLNNKIEKTFSYLSDYWSVPEEEVKTLEYQTSTQLKTLSGRIGQPIKTEFLDTKRSGDSLILHSFLLKYHNAPMTFNCVFYKPKNAWIIDSVFWLPISPAQFY